MAKSESAVSEKEHEESLQFHQKRDMLYDECEYFIDELIADTGKPWGSALDDAERISEKVAHALDIEKLAIYETELKRVKAEVEEIKELVKEDPEYAYRVFSDWLRDRGDIREDIIERRRDRMELRFNQRLDMLYAECEDFIEELIEDMGKPWYYSAKGRAERISEKIAHALDMKKLKVYEKELRSAKEKVKRIKEKAEREGFE